MQETWKPVLGYEGIYEVSTQGELRSLPKKILHYSGKLLDRKGRVLRGHVNKKGYVKVSLCDQGKMKGFHVHVLVAMSFHGPRPSPSHVVRHLDGNQLNNAPSNLAWGTHKENSDDIKRHGRGLQGESVGNSKLKEGQVLEIRRLASQNVPRKQIAALFGASYSQVDNIIHRRHWKHI